MRSWLGFLAVALAAGSGVVGTKCGNSMRVPSQDAGGDLAGAIPSGGVAGAGGLLGAGGATARAGSPGSGRGGTGGTTVLGAGGRGGTGGATVLGSGGRGGAVSNGGAATGGIGGLGTGGKSSAGGSGGGNATHGGTIDANVEVAGAGGVDATVVDPTQFCEMWQARGSAQDTLDLQQYGLFTAGTVFVGTLGDFAESGDISYARLSVDRVWAGIRQCEGLATAIRIERALCGQFDKGGQVIVGIGQTHPLLDESLAMPVWDQPQALLAKSSAVAAELLGFHA
jgi:hypothetical protein